MPPQSASAVQSPSPPSSSPQPKPASSGTPSDPSGQSIPSDPQPSVVTPADPIATSHSIAALPWTTNAASVLQIGPQTLAPGGSAVIYSGTTYSLAPSASSVIVNGVPAQLPVPAASKPAVITLAGQSYTANSALNFLIDSQTLTPGGLITAAGATLSLAPSASFLVIGTSTQTLNTSPTAAPAVLTLAGQTITANSASNFIIGSQTLTPGSVITVSGTLISLAASGTYIVAGTSTIPLLPATGTSAPAEAFTFAGQTFTADSASDFVIGGQTLKPGSAITVLGMPISLAATPTDVVIGTSTQGLASLIMGGFGGGGANATVASFEGAGAGWQLGWKLVWATAVLAALFGYWME